ncbi:MAG: hypothetical protein H7263_12740 [Candidatus Sericytochromatia bacterium]|nr:hypothetical protein [Candidatus Sericytochromatia bacterium]
MIFTDSKVTNYTLYLKYNSWQDGQKPTTVSVKIGDGKNDISLQLLLKVMQYAKNANSKNTNSFQEVLDAALYKGLSESEKQLLTTLKNDSESIAQGDVSLKEENKDDVQLLKNIPTDEYLKDLKSLEDLDFKIRNLDKFHKKMQKISGNLPLEEMFLDVAGTSTQLSNLHITDMNRLNNLNINSPSFH